MASPTPDDAPSELVSAVLTASRVLVAVSARSLAQVEERVTLAPVPGAGRAEQRGKGRTNLNRLADALAGPRRPPADGRPSGRRGPGDPAGEPENRREVLLGLTVDGERIVRDVTSTRREEIAAILQRMSARNAPSWSPPSTRSRRPPTSPR